VRATWVLEAPVQTHSSKWIWIDPGRLHTPVELQTTGTKNWGTFCPPDFVPYCTDLPVYTPTGFWKTAAAALASILEDQRQRLTVEFTVKPRWILVRLAMQCADARESL